MNASDEEIVNAVTAKLTGEFYVGQRVRISRNFTLMHIRGLEATVIEVNKHYLRLSPPIFADGTWHRSNIEPT